MSSLFFTKMQGAGNDYLYFDCTRAPLADPSAVAVRLSDRHFGAGSDGIVLILPSETADFRMRMFNADGSEAEMCGNAVRCVGKYIHDRGLSAKNPLTIETKAGIKILDLTIEDGAVTRVRVDMGPASFDAQAIPMRGERVQALSFEGRDYTLYGVSMGNPHAVIFGPDPDTVDVHRIGAYFETHPVFPAKANIEFAEVLSRTHLKVRVWERGSGETMACGTGACAAAAAAAEAGLCDTEEDIAVDMPGGTLTIRLENGTVYLSGGAEFVYDGSCRIE